MSSRKDEEVTPADDMHGWYVYCFTCKQKAEKRRVHQDHLNHDVDWVRRKDGVRYMWMPDGTVPRVGPVGFVG